MNAQSPFAPYTNLAELHARTYARHSIDQQRECAPTFTLDAALDAWRAETPVEDVARLNAEWAEDERLFEAARVEHGRGTEAYRAERRRIIDRPRV